MTSLYRALDPDTPVRDASTLDIGEAVIVNISDWLEGAHGVRGRVERIEGDVVLVRVSEAVKIAVPLKAEGAAP